jgi:hypothetical protein
MQPTQKLTDTIVVEPLFALFSPLVDVVSTMFETPLAIFPPLLIIDVVE